MKNDGAAYTRIHRWPPNGLSLNADGNGYEPIYLGNNTGVDGAALIMQSITPGFVASGFDTRADILFTEMSDSLHIFDMMGIQQEHVVGPDASDVIVAIKSFGVNEPIYLNNALGGASVMSQVTPDLVARMFPGAPRTNIERYLPLIRRALSERGLVDKMMVLMALATIRVESAQFDTISEAPSALNTKPPGPPFNKYDWRQDLGNQGPPDGAMFKGRGFIQLTGRKNYGFYGAMLGHNLIGNPELANSPQPAAQILAAYLKENELAIRNALAASDLASARRVVNGGVNGLDGFAAAFMAGHQLIRGYDGDLALSKEPRKIRESRKPKEVKADSISTSAAKSFKSKEKKRDDVAGGKTKAKKMDDVADGKTKAKKADGEKDENNGTDGQGKRKGFFLFRPFRLLRGLSSLR